MSEFRIKIERNTETTWQFVIETNVGETRISASDFMDPIGALFSKMRLFLKNGESSAIVSTIDEPEENIFVLNKEDESIRVEVLNFKDYSGESRDLSKGEVIFTGTMSFNRFLNQIINSLNHQKGEKHIFDLLEEIVDLRRKTTYNNA